MIVGKRRAAGSRARRAQRLDYFEGVRIALVGLAFVADLPSARAADCRVVPVLFGSVSLQPVRDGGEVLVKEDSMAPGQSFGALRGTITASREGLIVLDRNGQRVALIERATGRVTSEDAECSRTIRVLPAAPAIAVVVNGDIPVGTIKGKLPH